MKNTSFLVLRGIFCGRMKTDPTHQTEDINVLSNGNFFITNKSFVIFLWRFMSLV